MTMAGLQAVLLAAAMTTTGGWRPPAGVFPILGWVGPPRATEQQYRLMAEAGFTIGLNLTAVETELARRVGMLSLYHLGTPDPATPEGRAKIDNAIAEARQFPNVVGYYLRDEPNASLFPLLGRIVAYIKQHDPGKLAFINLYPTYANERQLGTKSYEEHVRRYIEEVKPQVVCYDNYPCVGEDGWRGDYYLNMEIIRRLSREAGLPFWNFILSVSHGPYREPTREDLALQAFSDLAYGSRGILYYTYGTPGSYKPAIVDKQGRPTHQYRRVRSLNAIIRSWGLFIEDVREVYHLGDLPRGTRPLPPDCPVRVRSSRPAVVSLLVAGDGKPGVMVVNKDRHHPAEVAVEVSSGNLREVACPTVAEAERWAALAEDAARRWWPRIGPGQGRKVATTIAPGFAKMWIIE